MTDQFQLTDDQLAIQDMARKFTADRITPFAAEWDEKHHYPARHDRRRRASSVLARFMSARNRAESAWAGWRRR